MINKTLFFLIYLIIAIFDSLDIIKINIMLLIIGSTPLLIDFIKTFEITPNGIKVTGKKLEADIEKEEEKFKQKLLGSNNDIKKVLNIHSYRFINDKNYALVKAKIDIENRLSKIATINNCEECKTNDFYSNIEELESRNLISIEMKEILLKYILYLIKKH